MKRLWIASAVILFMLGFGLVNAWYAQSFTQSMVEQLHQAQQLAMEENWSQSEQVTRQVYDDWQSRHFYLHTVMRHSDTDQILRNFHQVLQYLELRDTNEYASSNAELISQLQLLAEMEQASVVNVL